MNYGPYAKKICSTDGCTTRVYGVGVLCGKCHANSPEGKAEKNRQALRLAWQRREDARLAAGLPLPEVHCNRCLHWGDGLCTMGFPEGFGSFAKDCSCYTVGQINLDAETNHPDIQEMVQQRLDRAYELAGRHEPSHPLHSLYTNVFGELAVKGIAV